MEPITNCVLNNITALYYNDGFWFAINADEFCESQSGKKFKALGFGNSETIKGTTSSKDHTSKEKFRRVANFSFFIDDYIGNSSESCSTKIDSMFTVPSQLINQDYVVIYLYKDEETNGSCIVTQRRNAIRDSRGGHISAMWLHAGNEGWETRHIDLFGHYSRHNASYGYRSDTIPYGTFRLYNLQGIGGVQTTVPYSPFFDPKVLLGCPQEFCFYTSLDAASYFNGSYIITAGNYFWRFNKFGLFLNSSHAQSLDNLFGLESFAEKENERSIMYIDELFTYKNVLYAFKGDELFYMYADEESFSITNLRMFFKNLEDVNDIIFEAVLIIDNTESYYFVFKMNDMTLDEDYLKSFEIGSRYFPRNISDFPHFPTSIDTVIKKIDSNEFFFFYGSFVYKIINWKGKYRAPKPELFLAQDLLFDCKLYNYAATPNETFSSHIHEINKFIPPQAVVTKVFTIKDILSYFYLALIGIILFGLTSSLSKKPRRRKLLKLKTKHSEKVETTFEKGKLRSVGEIKQNGKG
ncbi:hypothetical protein B4U79_17825 [Dinothrombium tinctorium]|uniref:Uncharacterized protein n=1 Tax=Dinothrombium tinctorium TaxID=1965070 RepID=A0A443RRN4_9ACAR|nr:hypothetical protein B4U79_17825 [Dinothrombium tinctorium]